MTTFEKLALLAITLLIIVILTIQSWQINDLYEIATSGSQGKTISILVTHHDGKYRVTDVWEEVK